MPMSSPILNQSNFTFVAETLTKTESIRSPQRGESALLTARAMVAVTLLGGGFWYVVWKVAVHFFAGH
jgi:hypothetical protein